MTSCALAILLASTIMFPRIAVEVVVIERPLAAPLWPPLAAMAAVGVAGCALLWRRSRATSADTGDGDEPRFSNPFSLGQAFKLTVAYALIRVVAAAAYALFGHGGLYASAALAGLTDVDGIAISIGRMHAAGLPSEVAVIGITLAAVTNTLTKAVMAVVLGGRKLGLTVAAVLVPAAGLGLTVALLL